jgi:dynein heavy chain
MNPDYEGRTALPDNLVALFRPMAMMVPDYKLIAEVYLYSSGYLAAKDLAKKLFQLSNYLLNNYHHNHIMTLVCVQSNLSYMQQKN